MRINVYVALATGLSRRTADVAIQNGQVSINGLTAKAGDKVETGDTVTLKGEPLALDPQTKTILFNKPVGFVCSRDGQGSRTIYDLLPKEFHNLKPVGRLDKDSSGLLLLTNDGQLAHQLTHPSFNKQKVYKVALNKPLVEKDKQQIEKGVLLEDGLSKLQLSTNYHLPTAKWQVTMTEGRNRQIRRTFEVLGYKVTNLHRKQFGDYQLNELAPGNYTFL